jgi:hypothetical protein
MRGGWQAVIRSLNLTEKQEQAAISIHPNARRDR